MHFATLDDSLVNKNGIFVYAHALVIKGDLKTIEFVGGKSQVFLHEQELFDFIRQNLNRHQLYACSHYLRYPLIKEIMHEELNRTKIRPMSLEIIKSFYLSDSSARETAKKKLEEVLASNLPKDELKK